MTTGNPELSRAHRELARRQSFTDALLETIEVGIVSCDAEGTFVVSNRAERRMFGFDENIGGLVSEEIDARIDVFQNDAKLPWRDYPLLRALRGDDVSQVDVVAGPVGGPYRDIVVRARQITSPDGAVLGAVAALADVTSERAAARALADEHRKLAEAQRLGQTGSFEYEFSTKTWTCSDNLCLLWGVRPGYLTPEVMQELIADDDWAAAVECWRAAQLGPAQSCELRIRRARDGEARLIRLTLEVELDGEGRPLRGRGTNLDITELDAAKKAAQRANAFFDAVLTASPDYTFVWRVETGTVLYGSRGKDLLGLDTDTMESLGSKGILTLVHPEDAEAARQFAVSATEVADGEVLQAQYRALHADGSWRWVSQRVTPFRRDSAEKVVEVLSVLRDVTEVVESERRLMRAARHDYLTGLPNRALLIERLDAALCRAAAEDRVVAVLFCDLDGFKSVNDTGGHAAGDAVLCETARRLTEVVRDGDTVARVGGDEFVVVVEPSARDLTQTSAAQRNAPRPARPEPDLALGVASRISDALRGPIHAAGHDYLVTASIGIAYARPGSNDVRADDVLYRADDAMYAAKARGKNRVEIFDVTANEPLDKESDWSLT